MIWSEDSMHERALSNSIVICVCHALGDDLPLQATILRYEGRTIEQSFLENTEPANLV